VGKYLRAVEKTLLVTSTHDSFPPLSVSEQLSAGRSAIVLGSTLQSAPSTPLFSPIPFLHEDARRSKSRSPPPTPLTLNPLDLPHELGLNATKNMGSQEPIGLGLVDEMDDPSPGHMSDHPTALSSVTTVMPPTVTAETKPLQERFVKAQTQDIKSEDSAPISEENMDVDEDKENDSKS
jgi:serine/threonine-protein phosphatase 4 regulatory subunit 2